jgi:hypothetical protein
MGNRVFQITELVEQAGGPFAVSRLIMLCGVALRDFRQDSPEVDDAVLQKVAASAQSLVSPDDALKISRIANNK